MYARYGLLIDNAWRPAAAGGTMPVFSPATEEQIGEIPAAAAADVATVLASAARGLQTWKAISAWDRARIMRNLSYAVQSCRRAVTSLFEAAGGSGIYDTAPLQRTWRDLNAASAHMAFGWDEAGVKFSRAYLGLPPSRFALR